MRVWSGRGKVLGKSHSIFKGIFEQKRRKLAKRAVPTSHFRTAWSSTVSRCSPYDALTQFPIWHEKAAAKRMLRGGLCVQRMERGFAGSPRQVPLRSLTAFFLDRFAIGGRWGPVRETRIVATQASLLAIPDAPPAFIDPGSLHSRTVGGALCSSRRSASLLRPLGALGFGPTGRGRLRSPRPLPRFARFYAISTLPTPTLFPLALSKSTSRLPVIDRRTGVSTG